MASRVNSRRAVRVVFALTVLVATAFVVDSALASSRSETSLQTLNRQVLASVNRFRAEHGLVALHESPALEREAPRPPKVTRIERDDDGNFVPVYDDQPV